jgi:hypothetical protein
MSENDSSEINDVIVESLEAESVIPHPLVEEYEKAVEDLKKKSSKAAKAEEDKDDSVISSEATKFNPAPSIISNEDQVIGSNSANKKEVVAEQPEKDNVAIYSTRNVTWSGVGKVYRGYNIVTKAALEKWVTRDHIRVATPEEVARDFGK